MGVEASHAQVKDDDLHGLVEICLKRIDQRYTPGRRAIVEFLAAHGHPVSISDIAAELPEVPRSSRARGWSGASPPATSSPGSSSPKTSPSTTTICSVAAVDG
jgi:hypothetical protein